MPLSKFLATKDVIVSQNCPMYQLYSVHLETHFFLTLISPVEGTEIGLTGVRKKRRIGHCAVLNLCNVVLFKKTPMYLKNVFIAIVSNI